MSDQTVELNKIVAIVAGRKSTSQKDLSALYHSLQRAEGMTGHTKTYRTAEEGIGDILPPDNRLVQANVRDILSRVSEINVGLLDAVATQDFGNTTASADIVVDGNILATDVPVPYLLYLEGRLKDLAAIVDKIPTLDLDKRWQNNGDGTFSSEPVETHRSVKTKKVIRLAEATREHPEQAQLVDNDELVGYWTTVNQSGAMPVFERDALQNRVRILTEAVKSAREEANETEVEQQRIGKSLMGFLLTS